MRKLNLLPVFIFLNFIIISGNLRAQEVNIIPYLQEIENGGEDKVLTELPKLKNEYPNSSSIIFLDAVLTGDGQKAIDKYSSFVEKFPKSKYADAALYRIYSYYFAVGMYKDSQSYLAKLKKNYPNSPYIAIAKRNIPLSDKIILTNATSDKNQTPVNKPPEQTKQKSNFTIQAGAFTVLSNAEVLEKELDSSGYDSRIEDKEIAGTVFHLVYAGGFSTRDEAKKALDIINAKYNLAGRVLDSSNRLETN
ncbi:MAG: SPOR domain-containing protein [Ignavibacteriaceae bacterium]